MLLLDRYLLFRFLRTLAVCFASVAGLYVVIDVFTNVEDFIEMSEAQGSMVQSLLEYYGPRVAWIFDRMGPFVVLLAAMFTVAWLHRSNELTALYSAGVSPRRIAKPLLGAAIAVALLSLVNRECVLPEYREELARNLRDWEGVKAKPLYPRYDNRTGILLGGQQLFQGDRRIGQPRFSFEEPMGDFGRFVAADRAFYQRPTADRPGGYLFDNVSEPENVSELPSLTLADRPTVLTRRDYPWLKAKQCFVVSDVDFEQLAGGATWRQFSSTRQLIAGLRNPSLEFGADVRVEVHSRMVRPFLDLTLLLLGLPLAFAVDQRNVFVAAGKGVVLALAFIFVVLFCQGLGAKLLIRPALAAWAPLLIFVPLVFFLRRSE